MSLKDSLDKVKKSFFEEGNSCRNFGRYDAEEYLEELEENDIGYDDLGTGEKLLKRGASAAKGSAVGAIEGSIVGAPIYAITGNPLLYALPISVETVRGAYNSIRGFGEGVQDYNNDNLMEEDDFMEYGKTKDYLDVDASDYCEFSF